MVFLCLVSFISDCLVLPTLFQGFTVLMLPSLYFLSIKRIVHLLFVPVLVCLLYIVIDYLFTVYYLFIPYNAFALHYIFSIYMYSVCLNIIQLLQKCNVKWSRFF